MADGEVVVGAVGEGVLGEGVDQEGEGPLGHIGIVGIVPKEF